MTMSNRCSMENRSLLHTVLHDSALDIFALTLRTEVKSFKKGPGPFQPCVICRVVSNSNAIRAHSHSHPLLDLERRESIRECELNEIVLTNPMNPHSAQ